MARVLFQIIRQAMPEKKKQKKILRDFPRGSIERIPRECYRQIIEKKKTPGK